ncbi:MAG: glycosyltransferase [Nocardioides sp.]|uniref:glycosyltransferase n=1 Tax=Nocardioides sp. TaxID=35761 RepID=UPI0039E4CE1F
MSSERYRLIASNLHVGGGVQVASSLIDEIAQLVDDPEWGPLIGRTDMEISTSVAHNIAAASSARLSARTVDRRPGRPGSLAWPAVARYAGSFTVFGPIYALPRADRRIMGYADVTSIYPPPVGVASTKARIRRALSRFEVGLQDTLVVETDSFRERIHTELGDRAPRIVVVPNTVNRRVLDAPLDESIAARVAAARAQGEVVLAYPSRPYPHKNFSFLPKVAGELRTRGLDVRYLVTLRDDEWKAAHPAMRRVCVNLGELTVDQIPTMMRAADGVFFPSLLEAFSATPVEALALGVPVYAADRDFVRTVCGEAAAYFDPINAKEAAETIERELRDDRGRERRVACGRAISAAQPTARDRAVSVLGLLYGRSRGGDAR